MSTSRFGDGSDGHAVLNGVTDVPWAVRSGRHLRYLMTRDAQLASLVIDEGITLAVHPDAEPVRLLCQGEIINRGTVYGIVRAAGQVVNEA
jgi:hypothetical protein